mgnify:CR=1 FL=1
MTKTLEQKIKDIEIILDRDRSTDFYHSDCDEELRELATDALELIRELRMKNYKQTEILQEQNRDLKRQLNKVISGQIDIFCKAGSRFNIKTKIINNA